MEQYSRLPISVLESLQEADGEEIHRIYQEEWKDFGRKVLVLDDDPTGIQTVHDVLFIRTGRSKAWKKACRRKTACSLY